MLRSEGARARRSYDGVNVFAVCVSVPVIFTTLPADVRFAPFVTLVREKSVPMKLSLAVPPVAVRDVEYVFCVVVQAVSVPDAVCTDDWKAFDPHRSVEVMVSATPVPGDTEVPHENPPPIASILSRIAFFVGTSRLPFHAVASYTSSATVTSQANAPTPAFVTEKVSVVPSDELIFFPVP